MAGLAPADALTAPYVLGAVLVTATGNVGLLLAWVDLADHVSGLLRWEAGLLGLTVITACGLFCFH